ncbi:MAG: hypothetical protein L3J45_09960 [Flavobacteriaceae bacterium]|nr:hypothetical protein [Flavobacteriaceae bacterium]
MVGSLLLKRIYNLSDERLVEAWVRPYMSRRYAGWNGSF